MDSDTTVYLLDHDLTALLPLAALVKMVFPRIKAYSSAAEFLAGYRTPQPGCLVFEASLPGMNGIELYRKLVQDKVALPVVFFAEHATVPMAVGAMQLGAVDFLEKPIPEQRLWDSIRKALDLDEQSRRRLEHRRQAEERLARLSPGEREVLHLMLEGKLNREIATSLGLSTRTIEDRRARLMKKLDTNSLAKLVQLVMTH
jgi:two-component system, LuxR family, response regulator FixJ